jgi:hypothetical protein
MARKHKRSQLKKPQRGSAGGGRAARPAGLPPVAPSQPGQPAQPGPPPPAAASLPVQRPLPRQPRGRQPAGPLPPQDATIPLERVPYFRADLRRIAITAGLMFVILIVGSIALRGLLQA